MRVPFFFLALSIAVWGQERPWVVESNRYTLPVIEGQARFVPESASINGLSQYDGLATDLGPGLEERERFSNDALLGDLRKALATARDENVRQDLEILVGWLERENEGLRLNQKYLMSWTDAPGHMFGGLKGLLGEQVAPERRVKALELLQRYVGQYPGSTPFCALARARFEASRGAGRLGPTRARVEDSIANAPTYAQGIRKLFVQYKIAGADEALAALDKQLAEYSEWQKTSVLPLARADFRLPPELYAYTLKKYGIPIEPQVLIARAQVEFMETRAALETLAPLVAKARGLKGVNYVEVIRELKKEKIPDDRLQAEYLDHNRQIEEKIRQFRVVDLPNRPMQMRLASQAESAAQPAPHMEPPPMVGNQGEKGTFVLPLSVGDQQYDDFNFPAATWTVSAHEGRPGHELQFTAMVERGISKARVLYAYNSVNVEGWALYSEAEMLPYHPLEGQLIALQVRLLRAARAFLDPMLNLGLISVEDARRILLEQVGVSPAMARQELDRYTFRAPGQAGTYFYGYVRLLELRMETELRLGSKFDRLRFNNFLLDQGLLPPDLLAKAVREQFR